MSKSITKNSIFYFIYNLLNMIFPFLTSMYVARVLPPVAIGEVAYAKNIVSYFSILAFLGLPTYGLREISKARNNYDELCKLFSELFIINFASTVIFSLAYYGMIFFIPEFQKQILLYVVVGITVVLNMLNISWLYEGLEEFRYVSIRNGVFKLFMFLLLLLAVRSPDDMIPYAFIAVFGVAGNNIVNIIYSRNFVRFTLQGLHIARHMKSIFMLVMVNLAIEVYSLVGTSLLGILSTKENVAFYSYATRANAILLQFNKTITMVLVPRIALYYSEGKMTEFNLLLSKALKVLVMMAVPMIVLMQFTADFLFPQLFGLSYLYSAYVEKILCVVVLIAPVGYLLGSRVMLISGKENIMVFCVSAGAIVNAVSNYFLIKAYGGIGAAIATVISEMVVATLYVSYGSKVFKLFPLRRNFMNVGMATALMCIFLFLTKWSFAKGWMLFIVQILGSITVYSLVLLMMRDTVFCDFMNRLVLKLGLKL